MGPKGPHQPEILLKTDDKTLVLDGKFTVKSTAWEDN
jgi:hypothetical protein